MITHIKNMLNLDQLNENYYLHRNIYKKYSSHGTPYLAEYCNLRTSNNLIIYGHHMNDNSMFAELVNYKNYNFPLACPIYQLRQAKPDRLSVS